MKLLCGDALTELKKLDDGIVQTCITSPPYWGLRDYGVDGQLGLESTPEEYIARLVEIFAEVKRGLRNDGTLWIVLGDSYTSGGRSTYGTWQPDSKQASHTAIKDAQRAPQPPGLKPKDLCMIPARVALALQADGWWLRSNIIWAKPNPMPESVTDRPTSAHEHVFLLAKSQRYFYDGDSIRELGQDWGERDRLPGSAFVDGTPGRSKQSGGKDCNFAERGRNKRNVWTVSTKPYPEAHFAVYPPALIEPCVLAGSADKACEVCGAPWERVVEIERSFESGSGRSGILPDGKHGGNYQGGGETLDIRMGPCISTTTTGFQPTCSCDNEGTGQSIILDPFFGSGTTGEVALKHRRKFIGIELNPEYVQLAEKRLREVEVVMF